MSDEEEVHSEEEEEEEDDDDEEEERKKKAEAELAQKKRREAERQRSTTAGLDDAAKELLEQNREDREKMEDEIKELRHRSEKRKKEREVEEKRLAKERAAEDARRKAEEEGRRRQKEEEVERRQRERALKMAEFEKWKNPPKANFVISKRSTSDAAGDDEEKADGGKGKKSKEQLEEEKRNVLKQRVKPLDIAGADSAKLTDKAKELYNLICRLEGEKYDLEKHFKAKQIDMMELAERARQANRVGKEGLKRAQTADQPVDKIQERFAGAPAKVEMYSKYERQKDKRSYEERLNLFTGPQFLSPPERIKPSKIVRWNDEGMPVYEDQAESAGGHQENHVNGGLVDGVAS